MQLVLKDYFYYRSQGQRPCDAWFHAMYYRRNQYGILESQETFYRSLGLL